MDGTFGRHFSGKESWPRFATDGSNLRSSLPWKGESASPRLRWIDPSDPRFSENGSTRRTHASRGRRVGLTSPQMDRLVRTLASRKESRPRLASDGSTRRTLTSFGRRVGLASPQMDRPVEPSLPSEGESASIRLRWIDSSGPSLLGEESRPRFAPDGRNLPPSLFREGKQASLRLRWIDPSDLHFPWRECRPPSASD